MAGEEGVVGGRRTGCRAPELQVFLTPRGEVGPCVRRLVSYGNVRDRSLVDLWRSAERRHLVDALGAHDYGAGCESCGTEVAAEGWVGSYPAAFSTMADAAGIGDEPRPWPAWIDFNLSNTCNLQCIQCSGELSSSIRSQRERRPPLPAVYDDRFFDDLRQVIPHLEGAHFAGGEPFLAAENYRVWDLIAELRPDLPVTVTTNGTTWTPRVERVLERLAVSFVLSIDSISPDTYRAIRVGAELDEVLANLERFRAYAARRGTSVSLNHCLMVQNHHEFADFLCWAEDLGLAVEVSVVRAPTSCSIARLPADELAAVHAGLQARDEELRARLVRNLGTWSAELARIGAWAEGAAHGSEQMAHWGETVVTLRRRGRGPSSAAPARAELGAFAADGQVHHVEVGPDGVIRWCSPSFADSLGIATDDLVGHHFDALQHVALATFGPRRAHRDLGLSDDRRDLLFQYGDTELRITMVAVRGDDGIAEHGEILLAARPVAP